MNSEEKTIPNYKKSFLIVVHVLLGLALVWFSSILSINYIQQDKLLGTSITIFMAILYFLLMAYSSKLFNQERYGLAYFLTIAGFLSTIFLQFITCVNIIPFKLH